jgi:hypothetical protein
MSVETSTTPNTSNSNGARQLKNALMSNFSNQLSKMSSPIRGASGSTPTTPNGGHSLHISNNTSTTPNNKLAPQALNFNPTTTTILVSKNNETIKVVIRISHLLIKKFSVLIILKIILLKRAQMLRL